MWVALRKLFQKKRDLDIPFGDQNACLGGWGKEAMFLNWGWWGAGGCCLGVEYICDLPGYSLWYLRQRLGTPNVLHLLGQSHKRESSPAHNNQQRPQTEMPFKYFGLTSQEAIRGGGERHQIMVTTSALPVSPKYNSLLKFSTWPLSPPDICLGVCFLPVSSRQNGSSVKARVKPL